MTSNRRVRATVLTHRGAVRESNEDALVIGSFTACGVDLSDPVTWEMSLDRPVLLAVADGLGGHQAGEVASAHAVQRLAQVGNRLGDAGDVVATLRQIDDELNEMSARSQSLAGMGTTVVGVVLQPEGGGLWFNVGDSRAYVERSGYLAQLSVDDSLKLPADVFGGAVISHRITQCLGSRSNDKLPEPHIGSLDWVEADRWLLCSDGLSDLVRIDDMERLLAPGDSEVRSVKALWVAAMNATGRDNISVVLVTVV